MFPPSRGRAAATFTCMTKRQLRRERTCEHCGDSFMGTSQQKYCSQTCSKAARRDAQRQYQREWKTHQEDEGQPMQEYEEETWNPDEHWAQVHRLTGGRKTGFEEE